MFKSPHKPRKWQRSIRFCNSNNTICPFAPVIRERVSSTERSLLQPHQQFLSEIYGRKQQPLGLLPSSHDRTEQFSRKAHDHFSKTRPLNNGSCHRLNVADLQPPGSISSPSSVFHYSRPFRAGGVCVWGWVSTEGAVLHPGAAEKRSRSFVLLIKSRQSTPGMENREMN